MVREESIENETLEIADLEYEVGGMGAVEPAEGRGPHKDSIVIFNPL